MEFFGIQWANQKDWVDILTACATPIIGLMTGYIAYQQWQTSEKQRKSDLSKKYFENYQKVSKGLGFVGAKATVDEETLEIFGLARDEARIFLSEEIANYTQKLYELAIDLNMQSVLLREAETQSDRSQAAAKKGDLNKSFFKEKAYEIYRKYTAIR